MILGTLLSAIAQILSLLINFYILIIVAAALVSWVRLDPYNPLVQMLYRLTAPVYVWLRRFFPTSINGIDFSPLIVAVVLKFIDLSLIRILENFARHISI